MPRYIAFLRGLNVGGHRVKMERLRSTFDGLGFSKVETFIASGNVIFETKSKDVASLKSTIEVGLKAALSYEVVTFLRTDSEVSAIAEYRPFLEALHQSASAFNVGFIDRILEPDVVSEILELKNEVDEFHVNGQEMYWLCQIRQSESPFFKVPLEKRFKIRATFRNMNTVRKLTGKYPPHTA